MSNGFNLLVPTSLLRDNPNEAEVVFRVGALTNALLSVGRRAPSERPKTRVELQDHTQLALVATGYIYELGSLLAERYGGVGWELAERGFQFTELPLFSNMAELRDLLRPGDSFMRSCCRVRDKYAFHVDPHPFAAYLGGLSGTGVLMMSLEGARSEDVVFPAAVDAILSAIPEGQNAEFVRDVNRVLGISPYLGEAMITGFLIKHDLDPVNFRALRKGETEDVRIGER